MKITIVRPIITEASMKDAGRGHFTFEIRPTATKTEVKREVEKAFKVNVKGVRTVTIKRTQIINTKFGRKKVNTTLKKARVVLAKGQMIDAFEVKDEKKKEKKTKETQEDKG